MVRRTGVGIWLFLAISGLGIGAFNALDNFYFHSLGYSVAFIGGLTAAFNVAVAIAEIPSALIFDRRSHWMAIQLGNLVRTIGLLLFYLSLGPIADMSAEVIAGVGAAAMSGTSTAYILNNLHGAKHETRRAMATVALIGSATSLLGGGVGVAVFLLQPRLIWLVSTVCMVLAGIVFLAGHRRDTGKAHRHVEPLISYVRGLGLIAIHPRAWLSICANAALVAPLLLWQLRLGSSSLYAILGGFAVMKAAGAVGSQIVAGRRIGRFAILFLLAANIAAVLTFAAAERVWLIILAFGVHVLLHIAISVYCGAEFQAVVPDSRRAGATSVVSLLGSFLTGAAALVVGALADSVSTVAAVAPSIALYACVAAIAFAPRRWRRSERPAVGGGAADAVAGGRAASTSTATGGD